MPMRQVDIVVTNSVVGSYEARSYPDQQTDASGRYPLYSVPLFRIQVSGKDDDGTPAVVDFMAPRFMPFYNNPKQPSSHYKALGWLNSGLSSHRRVVVTQFKRDYAVQNRYSPGRGAIVVHGSFYIHAGPASILDYGFGSAGCIEIVGDYNVFKQTIADFSGQSSDPDDAIQQLVHDKKLIVTIQSGNPPDIRKNFTRMTQ
jgi:hypothetical protein